MYKQPEIAQQATGFSIYYTTLLCNHETPNCASFSMVFMELTHLTRKPDSSMHSFYTGLLTVRYSPSIPSIITSCLYRAPPHMCIENTATGSYWEANTAINETKCHSSLKALKVLYFYIHKLSGTLKNVSPFLAILTRELKCYEHDAVFIKLK